MKSIGFVVMYPSEVTEMLGRSCLVKSLWTTGPALPKYALTSINPELWYVDRYNVPPLTKNGVRGDWTELPPPQTACNSAKSS